MTLPDRDRTIWTLGQYVPLPFDTIRSLCDEWDAPGRVYHSFPHLSLMVKDLMEMATIYGLKDEDRSEMLTTALFHDLVYVAGAKDNEDQSALRVWTYDSLTFSMKWSVDRNIMKTVNHLYPDTFLQACIIDADLAGLGRDYEANRDRVRAEYPGVTDEQWFVGRKAFLESMLQRNPIFFTSWGALFEDAAQAFINAEYQACNRAIQALTKEGSTE